MITDPVHSALIQQLTNLFSTLPQVNAITLGGSRMGGGLIDPSSDIDIYVYTQTDIPLAFRQEIVRRSGGASKADLGMNYWGLGDEWINLPAGIEIDIIYFDVHWFEQQIERVIDRHEANLGYTTCLWYTARHSQGLYDPLGWFQILQDSAKAAYPDALRRNIISLNHPVLRNVIPSYFNQIEKAWKRDDLVSVNHRLAGLLASYFDILFALNRELHPGEKKILRHALTRCTILPVAMAEDICAVIQSSCAPEQAFLLRLTQILDNLDQCLELEGFDPSILKSYINNNNL